MTKEERDKIFFENFNLIGFTIHKYFFYETGKKEDLWQVAALSMLANIPKLDMNMKKAHSSYLVKCMIGSVRRYIHNDTTIHIPDRLFKEVITDKNVSNPASIDFRNGVGTVYGNIIKSNNTDINCIELTETAQQTLSARDYDLLVDAAKGYTVEELSKKYGLKEKTVRVIKSNARKKLREEIRGC